MAWSAKQRKAFNATIKARSATKKKYNSVLKDIDSGQKQVIPSFLLRGSALPEVIKSNFETEYQVPANFTPEELRDDPLKSSDIPAANRDMRSTDTVTDSLTLDRKYADFGFKMAVEKIDIVAGILDQFNVGKMTAIDAIIAIRSELAES